MPDTLTPAATDTVELTRALVRCESVTPREAGALQLLEKALASVGFRCERMDFSEKGADDVANLYARIGEDKDGNGKHFCFAGHSDVSPPAEDFKAAGFTLVGGRADYVHGSRAAVVVYRHGAHVINLFAWADHDARLPGTSSRDGYRMVFWKQKDLDLAAVSDVDPAELDRFVDLVKKSQPRE